MFRIVLAAAATAACGLTGAANLPTPAHAAGPGVPTAAHPADSGISTAAHAAHAGPAGPADPRPDGLRLTGAERSMLLAATRRFRDVREAVRAGYLPTDDCVPGMGLHYSNPALAADPRIDPEHPEILLYVRGDHGRVHLAGLEYYRPDADGDLRTDGDRPALFGHRFNGPMLGHPVPVGAPPMPVHYDLHVWLYTRNPAGELTTDNPVITCH
ncbi:hypothetical protein ACWT_2599 [Actinoplanes sp. SE50]|nr:hypothetical protein ACPL_2947 [Actinoplanes sp. SE50/110]ATO82014.1 hypothetical protein ACWT_2599 [Actinoplanes sp. SE50]SLL99422.1 hypothetical protein ACSP50_2653 [Actinoplanes sp. SE50/110]